MDLELDFVRSLIKLMSEHNMTEMNLEEGEQKIHLLRGQSSSESKVTQVSTVIPTMMPITIPTVANAMPAVVPLAAAAPAIDNSIQIVKSPMVGTFYRSPTPDSDPFVDTGDVVREDTQLAIIEAMKVMNEITAEVSGEIVEILVANAEAVEYDQPLFHIRKID